MKRLIYILSVGLLLISSCSKPEVEPLFDKLPEERMLERNAELTSVLLGTENGWKAFLKTSLRGGGYGFYMDFDNQNKVTMVADWDDESAKMPKESTYRVQYISNSTLIFDTYTYITILQDPNNAYNGGTQKEGLQSDIEFEYTKVSGDTVFLTGRKYRNTLYLIKANAEEESLYKNGNYQEAISRVTDYFLANPVSYIEFDGERYQLFINAEEKTLDVASFINGEVVTNPKESFAFTLDGIQTPVGLQVGNNVVEYFQFIDQKLFAITASGEQKEVVSSDDAVIPLNRLLGVKYSGLYSGFKTIYPGTNSVGADILNYFHDNVTNSSMVGFSFDDGYLYLVWDVANKRIELRGASYQRWNNNNNPFITTYVYSYTETDDEYSLSYLSGPSGGYVSSIMSELHTFLLNNKFNVDYFFDSGNAYGKIKGTDQPEVEMTFLLQ